MTERRKWKSEEKLAILKKDAVIETCRKYSVDPSMYCKRKECYDTFGLEGLKSRSRRMEPGIRKLVKENQRLNTLLVEKELENALLSESLKKMVRKR